MEEQSLLPAPPHLTHTPLHLCTPQSHNTPVQSQPCEQESRATTAVTGGDLNLEDLNDSHDALSGYMDMQCRQKMDADLDLSLGYGNHHRSRVMALDDESINGLAATDVPLTSSTTGNKSVEDKDWENMPCPDASNHRFSSLLVDTSCRSMIPANGAFTTSLHDGKVFFCKFCDRQFHSSQALGGHQNAHKRERLVARSTPRMFFPAFYHSQRLLASTTNNAPLQPSGHPLPPCLGADASKGFPLAAIEHAERTQSTMLNVPRMCRTNGFQAPHHASTMCKTTGFGCHYMCGGNATYITGNRSLGIKVHSLVHKPPTAQVFQQMTPQMGHLKGQMVNIVGCSAGMARRFATGLDCSRRGSLQTAAGFEDAFYTSTPSATSRVVCHREEAGALLHRHRLVTHSHSPLPARTQLETVASPSTVDLALHL